MPLKAVVQLQKRVLSLSEAAEWLGVSEYDLRLRVRQKIIRPVRFNQEDKLLFLRDDLYFRREDIESQWRDFICVERDLRDQVQFLIVTVRQMALDVQGILERVQLPDYIGLKALSNYLGVHPVTLRKKVSSRDGITGYIELDGHGRLACHKIERAWKVSRVDLKKYL